MDNEKKDVSCRGLTFPKFWLILSVEVDVSTSLLKFEISRRVGNCSLRRSENSRIFSLSFETYNYAVVLGGMIYPAFSERLKSNPSNA